MEVLKERYSITELSEILQISDHALRFYEKEFELTVPKDERGRRYYTPDLANIMYKIKVMRSEGLEIKAIKKIIQEDCVFEAPQKYLDTSSTSLAPQTDKGKELESIMLVFRELGQQFSQEISGEIITAKDQLFREINKTKLELGACVENSIRRLENKMDKHNEEVDRALGKWREKARKRSGNKLFQRIFRDKYRGV